MGGLGHAAGRAPVRPQNPEPWDLGIGASGGADVLSWWHTKTSGAPLPSNVCKGDCDSPLDWGPYPDTLPSTLR